MKITPVVFQILRFTKDVNTERKMKIRVITESDEFLRLRLVFRSL